MEDGTSAVWKIGPLEIMVQRLQSEWLATHQQINETELEDAWHFERGTEDLREVEQVSRFAFQKTSELLMVLPALADRSVVSRPISPFTVPAGEHSEIFISTPLWFTAATGKLAQSLFEIPFVRLSDTWFGPSTQEGEVCYAVRTNVRLNLENLEVRPYRAITQVRINNEADEPLLVERLNLPVTYLSLFNGGGSGLWTEAVTMVQSRGTSLSEFKIEKEPPSVVENAKLIAPPRQTAEKGMLVRAFSAITLQGFD